MPHTLDWLWPAPGVSGCRRGWGQASLVLTLQAWVQQVFLPDLRLFCVIIYPRHPVLKNVFNFLKLKTYVFADGLISLIPSREMFKAPNSIIQ